MADEKYRKSNIEFACFMDNEYSILKDVNGLEYAISKGAYCLNWTELKYHKDWNLLMDVINKIFSIDTGTLDTYTLYIEDSLMSAEIKIVYESVYDFIKWFNTSIKK